jgi:hypothetical protein
MVKTRRPHYLRENRGRDKPLVVIFVDVETKQEQVSPDKTVHKLWFGWALYWQRRGKGRRDTEQWLFFRDTNTFWDWLAKKHNRKHTLHLISHNINYDMQVLNFAQELQARGYKLTRIYNKGTTTIIRAQKPHQPLVILDNMNWFKCSLRALGDAVGLAKLDVDPLTADEDLVIPYCKRDVEIMHEAWRQWFQFIDEHDLGNWSATLPGQAFNAFKHRFMKHRILVHNDENALALEREAYRGGRTSVFYRGSLAGKRVIKLDINSAYPAAMKTTYMPIKLLFHTRHITIKELQTLLETKCAIARVTLETQEPVFPVKYKGHNTYPVGRFTTVLSTPELQHALDNCHIVSVKEAAIYEQAIIFAEYVDYFYQMKDRYKREQNWPFYMMTKLMLNGLYGKFGQRATSFREVEPGDDVIDSATILIDASGKKQGNVYRYGNQLFIEEEAGESNDSVVAIAAHVTAAVRIRLWNLIKKAGRDNVYYCDTDSLFVSEDGLRNLIDEIDPHALGKLKLEDTAEDCEILAPKTYFWHGKWTRKGIPKDALETGENAFTFDMFPSMRGIAAKGGASEYYTKKMTRTLTYTIYDGEVTEEGWVKPIMINMEE